MMEKKVMLSTLVCRERTIRAGDIVFFSRTQRRAVKKPKHAIVRSSLMAMNLEVIWKQKVALVAFSRASENDFLK